MFERIRGIFKPKEDKEVILDMGTIRERISDLMKEDNEQQISGALQLRLQIEEKLVSLLQLFIELRNAEIPEPRARASKEIKDKFSDKSIRIIKAYQIPEIRNTEEIGIFCDSLKNLINKITLTPKEAMHIKFFFTEQTNAIGKEINELSNAVRDIENSIGNTRASEANNIMDKIDNLINDRSLLNIKNKELQTELSLLADQRQSLKMNDLSAILELKAQIKELESGKKKSEEYIAVAIGSISKVIKKWAHDKPASNGLQVIAKSYVDDPVSTFISDENLKINDILVACLIEIKNGKIKIEKRQEERIEKILKELPELVKKREHVLNMKYEISVLEGKLSSGLALEEENKAMEKEKSILDKKISRIEELIDINMKEIKKIDDRISGNIKELEKEMSRILNKNIMISY